jgi:hypothetical protein
MVRAKFKCTEKTEYAEGFKVTLDMMSRIGINCCTVGLSTTRILF